MSRKRKIYELKKDLLKLFDAAREKDKRAMEYYIMEISENTGIGFTTLMEFVRESAEKNETIAQLRYRVIGDMQKRKMDTSLIA